MNWAVIMAGGSGTRFWPLSRKNRPKQLLTLLTERSLLIETVTRIAPGRVPWDRVLIVLGPHLEAPTRGALGPLGCRLVVEPRPRNTAPCIALAAAVVAAEDPEGVMAVLPADQYITDTEGYGAVFDHATALAAGGRIVTIGIKPDRPETGYGYIRRSDRAVSPIAWAVDAFVEKPDEPTARSYVADGRYSWNSGMFYMRADTLLDAVDRHMPGLSEGIAGYRAALGGSDEQAALDRCFAITEAQSIDYGVMEKEADNIAVVPADFGWNDVGSWRTVLDYKGDAENFVRGDATLVDTTESVVVSEGPHVAVIGMEGVAVVATGDAVLVIPLDRAQDVREVVDRLPGGLK